MYFIDKKNMKHHLFPIEVEKFEAIIVSTSNSNAFALKLKTMKTLGYSHVVCSHYSQLSELLRYAEDFHEHTLTIEY